MLSSRLRYPIIITLLLFANWYLDADTSDGLTEQEFEDMVNIDTIMTFHCTLYTQSSIDKSHGIHDKMAFLVPFFWLFHVADQRIALSLKHSWD